MDNFSTDSFDIYCKTAAKYNVFSPGEEKEYMEKIDSFERQMIEEIFTFKPIRRFLVKDYVKGLDKDVAEKVNSASRKELNKTLVHTSRFSESGRRWVEKILDVANGRIKDYLPFSDEKEEWLKTTKDRQDWIVEKRAFFIAKNLRLVIRMSRTVKTYGRVNRIDLIQEGNMGLMKAVERFDVTRGFRFSTYASWWIRHYMNRYSIDKGRNVRIPVHMVEVMTKVRKVEIKYYNLKGRLPTDEEILDETNINPERLVRAKEYKNSIELSLDTPIGKEEDGVTYKSTIVDEREALSDDVYDGRELSKELKRAMKDLPEFERQILMWRFGLLKNEETLKQIGDKHNLSRERIRQLEERALSRMRSTRLHSFL